MKKLNKRLKQSVITTVICLLVLLICHFLPNNVPAMILRIVSLGVLVLVYVRTFVE